MSHALQISKKIGPLTAKLPSDILLKLCLTTDLKKEFYRQRKFFSYLGLCLKSRFGRGGGNPALSDWKRGIITKEYYNLMMSAVDFFQSIFNLIQCGWLYIEEELKQSIDDYPSDEVSMFLAVLTEFADQQLRNCINGSKFTLSEAEKITKKSRDTLWQNLDDAALRSEWEYCKSVGLNYNYFWLFLIIGICESNLKNDQVLSRQYKEMESKCAYFFDLLLLEVQRDRKKQKPLLSSQKWEKGKLYLGTKGGFRAVYKT